MTRGRASARGRSSRTPLAADVPLERGQFTVNLGEVMTRWTNGVFKHVVHRVPNPEPGSEGNTGGHACERRCSLGCVSHTDGAVLQTASA